MVKTSNVMLAVAAICGPMPALAFDTAMEYEERSLDSFREDYFTTREFIESFYGRELTNVELQEREPFLGLIAAAAKAAGRVGTRVAGKLGKKVVTKVARKGTKEGVKQSYDQRQRNRDRNSRQRVKRSLDVFEDDFDLMLRDNFEDLMEEREAYDDHFEIRDYEVDDLD